MIYRIKQKVWAVSIRKAVKEKFYQPNGVEVCEHEIIGISKHKICIDTDWFTTFSLVKDGCRKDRYNSYLDSISVSIRTDNNILGDGVFIELFSTKKPTKATLRKMVATASVEIDKKYGFLFNGVKNELYEMIENYK